ncbi:hypothetical protein J6590_086015 [Homalodisca vitripennis]|nr:hypothetical protein J6590_086015 [Homalodisca vitripennis]
MTCMLKPEIPSLPRCGHEYLSHAFQRYRLGLRVSDNRGVPVSQLGELHQQHEHADSISSVRYLTHIPSITVQGYTIPGAGGAARLIGDSLRPHSNLGQPLSRSQLSAPPHGPSPAGCTTDPSGSRWECYHIAHRKEYSAHSPLPEGLTSPVYPITWKLEKYNCELNPHFRSRHGAYFFKAVALDKSKYSILISTSRIPIPDKDRLRYTPIANYIKILCNHTTGEVKTSGSDESALYSFLWAGSNDQSLLLDTQIFWIAPVRQATVFCLGRHFVWQSCLIAREQKIKYPGRDDNIPIVILRDLQYILQERDHVVEHSIGTLIKADQDYYEDARKHLDYRRQGNSNSH